MNRLQTIAKVGGWEVVYNENGLVSIHHGNGAWITNYQSVRDAIVAQVQDMDIRKELMRQWGEWMDRTNKQEVRR